MYIHKDRYPTDASDEHTHAAGDLPTHVLKGIGVKSGMLELLQDISPF